MASLLPPLPPPPRVPSPRAERRLRAASAILVALLLGGGLWVELRALGWLPPPEAACSARTTDAP